MIENIPFAYQEDGEEEDSEFAKSMGNKDEVKVINVAEHKILDHFGIPSSHKLMEAEASQADDIRKFKNKIPEIIAEKLQKK